MAENDKNSTLNRRDFISLGACVAATTVTRGAPVAAKAGPDLRTPVCDILGIKYPVLQAGMGGVAGPELVAAVSRAGGLGILTGTLVPPEELRIRIRRVRQLTDQPFGVNLILHDDLRTLIDASRIPEGLIRSVQRQLNRFRKRLGLPQTLSRPAAVPDWLDASLRVIIEERVPVWSIGLGNAAPELVNKVHSRGIRVIAMVATVVDAREVAASGVDIIVAQGSEAGGHRSTWRKPDSKEAANIGTMALVPRIVDAVNVPVIAAGGIADGRGLAAALALGAAGVMIGTRFIPTQESIAPDFHKRAVLEHSADSTTVTDVFTGAYARVVSNRFTREYAASRAPVLPPFVQASATEEIHRAAVAQGNGDLAPLYCGQGIGGYRAIANAGEVVEQILREARTTVQQLAKLANHSES